VHYAFGKGEVSIRLGVVANGSVEGEMNRQIVFREFYSRGEAEIVRELLLANEIESFVNSDDCGSVDPALSFARGVQLYVEEEDAPLAEKVLSEAFTDIPEDEGASND
jgi:hypothetical protein